MLTTGEDGADQRNGDKAFGQCKTDVRPGVVDSADITRALGDEAELMIWREALGSRSVVIVLCDGVLCEGLEGVDRTTCVIPKAMPLDWRQISEWAHALKRDCGSRAEPQDGHIVINFSRTNASRNTV